MTPTTGDVRRGTALKKYIIDSFNPVLAALLSYNLPAAEIAESALALTLMSELNLVLRMHNVLPFSFSFYACLFFKMDKITNIPETLSWVGRGANEKLVHTVWNGSHCFCVVASALFSVSHCFRLKNCCEMKEEGIKTVKVYKE